jgi:hypothetical protein
VTAAVILKNNGEPPTVQRKHNNIRPPIIVEINPRINPHHVPPPAPLLMTRQKKLKATKPTRIAKMVKRRGP